MAGRNARLLAAGSLVLLVMGIIGWTCLHRPVAPDGVDTLLLLLPDGVDATDPRVTIWLDAAAEEGLHVRVGRDSEFIRHPVGNRKFRGVILPDQVHRTASDALVYAVQRYVETGGRLLLVYDAGTLTPTGVYPIPKSRFSRMAGIDYALYDQLRDQTTGHTPVRGTPASLQALRVPPGKYMPIGTAAKSGQPVSGISGYGYGFLKYPAFALRGSYRGKALLSSPTGGLVAGYHPHGRGGVLFVNLPVGYLKGQTDGLLLHGMLHYFAVRTLQLPYLSPLPGGKAGMVLNVHCDSNAALAPIERLEALGIWKEGPFSIHITAGPDCGRPGDGMGLNVAGNPTIRGWIAHFMAQNHTIGSHGGWIHDYYGHNVKETNQPEFEKYLVLNKDTLAAVTGRPGLEYSAPLGNQPQWSTTWLERHGVLGYYFAGNTGMAPTRSYLNGRRINSRIWSFPFSSYGAAASFEEFTAQRTGDPEVIRWLTGLVDFCVEQRTSRLFYFHPPGAAARPKLLPALLRHARHHALTDRFRWYTMTEQAQYLNRREEVDWSVTQEADGAQRFVATHPVDLGQLTWVLPAASYQRPVIQSGTGTVRQDRKEWLVTVTAGKSFRFTAYPTLGAGSRVQDEVQRM
jgi:hypothetical protein